MNASNLLNQKKYRVGFLALNPPSHLYHLAPIAFELSKMQNISVILYYSTNESLSLLEIISDCYPGNKCQFVYLQTSLLHRLLRLFKKRPHPRVRNVIAHNRSVLLNHHALVMTDKHMLEFKSSDGPKYICAYHGAGDRQTAFASRYNDFDLLLIAGRAKWERMQHTGIVDETKGKVVGYPKFDPPLSSSVPERFFSDNKPVVIYAPHFNTNETSWYSWGLEVLEYFYRNQEFNLIFAPHVMLFSKCNHNLPDKYLKAENMLIDVDSIRLSDMSYTKTADIYLGDVSSQVYEFIGYKTRPCLFLNPHNVSWQGKDNFRMWQTGNVVDQIEDLDLAVRTASDRFSTYQAIQEKIVEDTFSTLSTSPGQRAAEAIVDLLAVDFHGDQDCENNSAQAPQRP
jgi:CDP-glycerol glycerophosphotransferase (TagB/SpsB family)